MIKKLTINEFDQVFALMEECFPSDEYRFYDEQKDLLKNDCYQIYGWMNGDDIQAFIALWQFDKFAFIEHFAVNPIYRNNGLGSKMLNQIVEMVKKPVCLEVELPDTSLAKRRIGFYQRNDFFLNEYPYIQPPMSEGKKPIPLLIMTTQQKLNKEEFEEVKKILHTKVYRYFGDELNLM